MTEKTEKICPVLLLTGVVTEASTQKELNLEAAFCYEDKCAWWVEPEPVRLSSGHFYNNGKKGRCGVAR